MEGLSRGSSRGRCQVLLDPRVILTRVAVDPHVVSRFLTLTHQGKSPSADVSIPAPPVRHPMRATPLPLARETIVRETSQGNSVKSSKRMRKLSLKRNSKSKLFSEAENSAAVESSNVYLINPITLKSEVPVAHRNSSSLNNGYSSTYSTPTKSVSDPSTRYSIPTKSVSDPSTRYSTPTKSTSDPSLFESPSTYIGPLTTNSLLTSPNVTLGSDFDGITDWFDFEDQIQTATKQLAIEPHESSKLITSEQLTNHPAAVPHFIEDAAYTPTPAVTISPDTSDLSMAANNTDTVSKIRKKGKSRKHFMKIKPPITLDSFGNPIKRKRGRPRTHPLIVTGQPFVKIEAQDVIQPHPLLAEPATKNKKKKQDKAAAQLITQVFGQGWEKRKFHNQTTAEDQGYYTCISGSDSSSRSSHIPVSHSPVGNMLSPDFTSRQPCVLIQDPILLGQEPVQNQNQDISVSVLESGQCDGQAALPNEPSDVELIRQLDVLLSNEGAHILDDMIIGETQEVTTYEDEEAILSSKSVTGCLVELQQCGRITGATHLASKQGSQTKMKQCKGPKVKRLVTNTKAVARPRRKSTPSMVNSRTKSGRTIKPTARMMDFNNCTNTLLDDSQPTSPDQGGSNESEEDAPTPIKKIVSEEALSSTVNDDAHTKATPVPPRATHIDPKLKLKLKDLRLSIPRSPITQRLGNFSFKLPKLSSLVTTLGTSCARIVTIESSPPPAPKRGVAFKDSSNPPTMMPPSTEAMTPSTPSNTLSMSLDAILREMDQSKAAEQMMSDDARLVTVKPVDPPIFQRLDSERMVRFTSPDFDGSLTDNDISDLFSPLDVETSLEQVLQGDGLFGPEPANTGPSRVVIDTSNDVPTASPVKIREVRFKLEEASEGLPAADDESVNASTAEEPFTFNLSPCNSFDMDSDVVATQHPIQGEPPDEDAIDLHADDFDMFDSDVKDTPLSGILFKRPPLPKTDARVQTTKTAPTPPPWRHIQRPPHTHPVSPKQGGSSPGYNHPPALMPYKKEQVSQWVAEAQRQTAFYPPTPHRALHVPGPFDPSWVLNRNGNSSNERLRFDEPPPRPTSPAGKPQGGKDLFPRSLLGGHCLFFLRGRCDFNNCRFKHTPLNLVPLHILEVASFQGTPVDSLPVEVLYHYGNDPPSCAQLLANWTQFTNLMHGLLYKNFGAVFVAYLYFSFSVQFTLDLLRRILELCSLQPPSTGHHGNPLVLAENIFAVLRKRGRLGRDICYLYYLKTISNFDVPLKLMEAYKVVRSLGEPPNYDILMLMLRLSKALGQRVFDLLEDIDKCVPPLTSMEAARCVNRLIDIADRALLLKHMNQLGRWLEHTSLSIISKITGPAFTKLSTLFTQEKSWSPLLTLYHSCPKYAAILEGSQISEALHTAVTVLGPSDKMADILSILCDDQLTGISSEVWNRMITDCAEKGKVQRARRFYRVAVTLKKQVSVHTSSALLRLLISQGEHSEAVGVLRQCLETTPLAPPPLSLLTPLCDIMDTPSDLQLVIKTLIVTNTTPPPAVLQNLLNAHSKQKAHQRLAEVVKLSLDYNMVLDKLFYQKVLVELRQWGRDQDAISTVYKALRRVENLETSDDGFGLPVGFESPPSPPPWPPTGGISPSVPIARTTKTLLPTPIIPPNPIAVVSGGCVAKAVSLENMMKASNSQDQSSLIKLIEVNGSLGQFGAVASVLVSFPDSQSHYDNQTVGVVWRAINSSSLRTANAFSNLLSALAQSRSHAFSTPPQTALLPSDRWLVSQIGIAILKIYEAKEDWQSGFVVLHHLHRYGVHYVKLSEPSANLPPCSPVPPTPCTVALSAINVCMHMDQVNGALEVLQGCEWIQASNTDELLCRTKLLTEMVEKFLHLRDSQNAWKCLLAIDSGTVVKNYQHAVTNLHNKLLQTLLSSKDVSLALSVYQVMRTNKLQCLPVYFSCLLQSLCSDHQELVAKELCKTAISESCYCALSGDNLLQVTLPAGLVRLELHLLLEDHLRRVVQTVGTLQPLLVQFNTGSRSHLEQVFSTDFDPPLTVHFLAKGSSFSLPPSSLTAWASRHNVTKPSPSHHTVPVTPMKAQSITELVGVTTAQATLPLLKASKRTVESHDSASDTLTVCPLATVPGEQCPADGDEGVAGRRPVRLKRKRSLCDTLSQDIHSPPTKKPLVGKELKHTACQLFINHLKPYYQAKKFKTPNDYKHLIKTLSLKYFKTLRTQEAPLLEAMDTDIAAIVASLMPRVNMYSSDLDHELGLYSPSSNSDDT